MENPKKKKKWEMRKYGKGRVYFMAVGTKNDYLCLRRNNKQLYDAIFGFAIGDVLGVPYEFQERGSFLCTDLTGYGCHHQPAGTWSDDTSMTLATLKSLKENNGKIHIEDIRKRFLS